MKLIEAEIEILKTETRRQLESVVESYINAIRYQYNYDLDYADNAIIAEMNLRTDLAKLLRLAHKREQTML